MEGLDTAILTLLCKESGAKCVKTMWICDFKHTDARKLTIGLVLGLFLMVAVTEGLAEMSVSKGPAWPEDLLHEATLLKHEQ